MRPHVLFIADYDGESGAGHLMRCIALSMALMDRGVETSFCTTDAAAQGLVEDTGASWLGCTGLRSGSSCEYDILESFASRDGFDLAVVDSYRVDCAVLGLLGDVVPVVYFDDLQAEALPVAAVINGNITCDEGRYASRYADLSTELYLGTRYGVLRDEFSSGARVSVRPVVTDILLSTGGSDPNDASLHIAKHVLSSPLLGGCVLHVMVGPLNRNAAALRQLGELDGRLDVQIGVSNVSGLMRKCDYAITAAGTTLNELCACGVPSIVYSLADNQDACARVFAEKGAAINIGRYPGSAFFDDLDDSMTRMISAENRKLISKNAVNLFDGKGAQRLASALHDAIMKKCIDKTV